MATPWHNFRQGQIGYSCHSTASKWQFGDLCYPQKSRKSLKDKANTKKEEELLSVYERVLHIYRDSLVVWKNKIESSSKEYLPKGKIVIISVELDDIQRKYSLPRESIGKLEYISEDSVRRIWAVARKELEHANTLFAGK